MAIRPRFAQRLLVAVLAFACGGCGHLPGRPTESSIVIDPDKISDFRLLFRENCSGCHGADGKQGAGIAIGDPVYLAFADDSVLRKVITNGIAGTSMPPFARSAGGMLTDDQIAVLVNGIRRWSQPNALAGVTPPSYASTQPGDPQRGAAVYATFCESCHGAGGKGGPKGSSIVDGTFLALLTDQELRTMIVVGRPDFGAPDWRNNVPGKPMSSEEISDVVAWLAAQRPKFAGRPYPSPPVGEHP